MNKITYHTLLFVIVLFFNRSLNSHDRLNIINSLLSKFSRPFTFLQIGPITNEFVDMSQNFKFGCFVGLTRTIDQAAVQQLAAKNLVILAKNFSYDDLDRLSTCENFDVITTSIEAANPANLSHLLGAFLAMSKYVIFESDSQTTIPWLEKWCRKNRISPVSYNLSNQKTLYILRKNGKIHLRATSLYLGHKASYYVINEFGRKLLAKPRQGKMTFSVWKPGIGLNTFKFFGGVYPNKTDIKIAILEAISECKFHNDLRANNVVLVGKKAHLIDCCDVNHKMVNSINQKMINLLLDTI